MRINALFTATWRSLPISAAALFSSFLLSGCRAPIAADERSQAAVYSQVEGNTISGGRLSQGTRAILHRFDMTDRFDESPDEVLQYIHNKAVTSGEQDLLFALAELSFVQGDRLRTSQKPWERGDPRSYYLASAVYSWFFLFDGSTNRQPDPFDVRFRAACNLYNYGLGWALTEPRGTNGVATIAGNTWQLPVGRIELQVGAVDTILSNVTTYVVGDRFVVRGLSARNRQPGLGTTLAAVIRPTAQVKLSRVQPATVFMRVEGGLASLEREDCKGVLELYSPFDTSAVRVGDRTIPLETDTTISIAYMLNQPLAWKLDRAQFLSGEEQVPSDIYQSRPFEPGRVPVVFVHGTFSSPVWWAEMVNTLSTDPLLRERCQFWYFIYNSGNPIPYSASRFRDALTARIKSLDPEGKDPALQQMVIIGHSQGGLLTKLTATDTGDKLWRIISTNSLEKSNLSKKQQDLVRSYMFFKPLPFVRRVVFIATPHRGSYLASNFARTLSRKLVTFPQKLLVHSKELVGLKEKLNFPAELKGMPTSLDSMSPSNPFLLTLADIPTAPGVKVNSIIAVEGEGDYHQGKDGLVKYTSAHVDYAESEFIVHSFHSCQDKPATIEEVRRILHEHLASIPPPSR